MHLETICLSSATSFIRFSAVCLCFQRPITLAEGCNPSHLGAPDVNDPGTPGLGFQSQLACPLMPDP